MISILITSGMSIILYGVFYLLWMWGMPDYVFVHLRETARQVNMFLIPVYLLTACTIKDTDKVQKIMAIVYLCLVVLTELALYEITQVSMFVGSFLFCVMIRTLYRFYYLDKTDYFR